MKYNKSEIMKKTWNIFRSTKHSFSESLKRAWAHAKELANTTVRYMIPDWFMNKNLDKVTTPHCMCHQTFAKEDIVKETEKALCIALGLITKSGYETYYTKNVWGPKSIIEEYVF